MPGPEAGPGRGLGDAQSGEASRQPGRHRRPAEDHVVLIDRFAWLGLLPWGCTAPIALTLGVTWLLLLDRRSN